MPLPSAGQANAIRVYRFKAGARPSAPQGGTHQGLAAMAELKRRAVELWQAEIKAFEAKAVAPALVVPNQSGSLYVVSLQHPAAGILRTTVIAIEAV